MTFHLEAIDDLPEPQRSAMRRIAGAFDQAQHAIDAAQGMELIVEGAALLIGCKRLQAREAVREMIARNLSGDNAATFRNALAIEPISLDDARSPAVIDPGLGNEKIIQGMMLITGDTRPNAVEGMKTLLRAAEA